jgi:hypothetical protein
MYFLLCFTGCDLWGITGNPQCCTWFFYYVLQGVVSGVLLVTPNAVMFDPNVSDSLVMEHGADTYGVIAPMDMIISCAMYHDIVAMNMRKKHKFVYIYN